MSLSLLEELAHVQANADCLYSREQIEHAIGRLAEEMDRELADSNPLFICIMNGGLAFTASLSMRFSFPLEMDYLHLSRYQGALEGGQVHWHAKPKTSLKNRTVVLLDDILDLGVSLQAAKDFCESAGATKVVSAVLLKKNLRSGKQLTQSDFFALECPDLYVFGYGMDYKNYLRNLNAIYVFNEEKKA